MDSQVLFAKFKTEQKKSTEKARQEAELRLKEKRKARGIGEEEKQEAARLFAKKWGTSPKKEKRSSLGRNQYE